MKHQALFSSKDKRNKIKCRLLHFCLAFKGETDCTCNLAIIFRTGQNNTQIQSKRSGKWHLLNIEREGSVKENRKQVGPARMVTLILMILELALDRTYQAPRL